jgi:hypothetical protein
MAKDGMAYAAYLGKVGGGTNVLATREAAVQVLNGERTIV